MITTRKLRSALAGCVYVFLGTALASCGGSSSGGSSSSNGGTSAVTYNMTITITDSGGNLSGRAVVLLAPTDSSYSPSPFSSVIHEGDAAVTAGPQAVIPISPTTATFPGYVNGSIYIDKNSDNRLNNGDLVWGPNASFLSIAGFCFTSLASLTSSVQSPVNWTAVADADFTSPFFSTWSGGLEPFSATGSSESPFLQPSSTVDHWGSR